MKQKILVDFGDGKREYIPTSSLSIEVDGQEISLSEYINGMNEKLLAARENQKAVRRQLIGVNTAISELQKKSEVQAEINKKLLALLKEIKAAQDSDLI